MGGSPDTKARLRREATELRRTLSPGALSDASHRVCGYVAGSPEYRHAGALVLYAARPGEVDVARLDPCDGRGPEIYYPRVDGTDLVFRRSHGRDLRRGSFGISEPSADAIELDPRRADVVVLVPGLVVWPGAVSNLGGPTSCGAWALHSVEYEDLVGCGAARSDVAIDALKLAPLAALACALGVALTVRLGGVYRRQRPAGTMAANPTRGA